MINDLVYKRIEFPLSKKDSRKIDVKNKSCINVYLLWKQIHVSHLRMRSKLWNSKYFFLISNENKSIHMYMKDFDRFMFSKTKS